jgi:hypothetical protein
MLFIIPFFLMVRYKIYIYGKILELDDGDPEVGGR